MKQSGWRGRRRAKRGVNQRRNGVAENRNGERDLKDFSLEVLNYFIGGGGVGSGV